MFIVSTPLPLSSFYHDPSQHIPPLNFMSFLDNLLG